ncbi:hypothetical protein FXO38_06150 [Capsicum annuum]|uniref:Pectinesterase inhibitor domain-containing protein n=1 Tax=Capsicum annuum TaxID=4072 RepID=A0A2G2YR49_CAPAN|nr:hypothetical protein FXO37_31877 [Capsicum annuum]KAF3672352.1 hypothetical protein FXO38_06150 [Capsicum annuum]PHT72220.1 hypothetical protein T459_23005 [Capsicum annuum]
MRRSISSSSSSSLVLFLPYMFLLSFDLCGANLRANADTQLIQKVCDGSTVKDFCYNIFRNDSYSQWATTKYNFEDITIQLAYSNYTNIHRKILTVTLNETNSEFRRIYRSCLHQYILLKSDFENLIYKLIFKGDLNEAVQNASSHIFTCMGYFTQFSNVPNPFAHDNENLIYFFELIRGIYFSPLDS